MKKNNLLYILLCITIAASSCRKIEPNTLTGSWHLLEYKPSSDQPTTKTFQEGDIIWNFNQEKLEVSVTHKSGVDFDVISPGDYRYNQGNGVSSVKGRTMHIHNLTIDGTPLGYAFVSENNMRISMEGMGGHFFLLERR